MEVTERNVKVSHDTSKRVVLSLANQIWFYVLTSGFHSGLVSDTK